MPRAFNATPKHPAIAYLVRLHSDLGGKILENRKEGKRLAASMQHVEAVLKLFDPDYNVSAIAARRRYKSNPWFKRGTLFRQALDVLRTAPDAMTVHELTDAVLAARGIVDVPKKQYDDLQAAIRASLEDHAGKSVVTVGEGIPKRWALAKG